MIDPFVVELFIALGVGALIGIEREQSASSEIFAGSRTFPLVALLGVLIGEFYPESFPLALAMISVAAIVGYGGKLMTESGIGMTTSIAMILTFVYGAMIAYSDRGLRFAVVIATLTTVLLASKGPIHSFAERIESDEMWSTLKFLIVSLVVLPLLPNREMDALLGLNPRFVWLMVVFVSGLSLAAYLLSKYLGAEKGILITGILGGIASSTATTTSLASQSRARDEISEIAGFGIAIASVAMLIRVLIEVWVVNSALLARVAVPLTAMLLGGAALLALVYSRVRSDEEPEVDLRNPFRLQPALVFGALFAGVLLISEWVSGRLGNEAIYATAVVSGIADVNAITLSLARLASNGQIDENVAAAGIVIGAVTNTVSKLLIAVFFGTRGVVRVAGLVLGGVAVMGLAVLAVGMSMG